MIRPRVGFLGTGWIGRHRMAAMVATDAIEAVAVCDPSRDCLEAAAQLAPAAQMSSCFEAMLDLDLDGIAIATPSALHAQQSIAALERGVAVFCQKPLGRSAAEAEAVVAAACQADRLLSVDFSYRHAAAAEPIAELVRSGALGEVFAADLVFHNAYGPDKPWFYDPAQAGGGCVMDLGVHLVDLALWLFDFPELCAVDATLLAGGRPVRDGQVEDYASAQLSFANGAVVRLACSWRLHAGRDAVIEASLYGTEGGATLRNVAGSFYDFEALRFRGTTTETLVSPPDDWGGRAAAAWARQLAESRAYDPAATRLVDVAQAVERIYNA